MRCSKARQNTNGCGTPDCGCGVQSAYIRAVFEDDARAEKTDAGDNVRRHPAARSRIASEQKSRHYESCGNKGIGPCTCHALRH